MKKRVRVSILLTCLVGVMVVVSCRKDPDPEPMNIGRTVLVYMATNNNLTNYSFEDVEEITAGFVPQWFDQGSGDVLLVYRHALNRNPHLIRISTREDKVVMDTLISYPEQNSCVDTTFKKVLKDAFGQYPSSERGLIVSSHGTGWLPEGYYDNPKGYSTAAVGEVSPAGAGTGSRRIVDLPVDDDPYSWMVKSFGHEDTGTEMEIDIFKNSLIYHFDWLVFDCCLMGGVEVAYQLRKCCDYIISSQTEIMADGFPYYGLMEIAFRKGSDVATRAMDMANLYYQHYEAKTAKEWRSATISVMKTSEMSALASSVKNILSAGGSANTDTLSMDYQGNLLYVQRYFRTNRHWFYDLDHYISQVCTDENLYSAFSKAMGKVVIYKASTSSFMKDAGGFDITHFSGVSTYVYRPRNTYLKEYYAKLEWGAAVGMSNLL